MFYSSLALIAGILPTGPVGESGGAEVDGQMAPRPGPAVAQREERAHASMTMKKTGDSQSADISAPFPGDAHEPGILTLAQLYERFRRPIHSYIFRLLGSQEDADDIAQEVFIRAFTAWDDLYDRQNLSAWLYRIATNLCVDVLRRRKRISWWPLTRRKHAREQSDDAGLDEDASYLPPGSGGIPEVAEREHIRMTLESMPRDYAIVLILSAAQGVSYQEIATIVGISPNAAATRISRAKRMFAENYQRLGAQGAGKQEQES